MSKRDRQIFADISVFWIDLFGRYFMIKEKNPKYLFITLSLSPTYIEAKLEWLKKQQDPLCQQLYSQEDSDIKEIGAIN